jgi:hypothetical protein
MSRHPDGSDKTMVAIRAVHDQLCEAMVAADITTLFEILADGFTLTHMTGYVQPKAEWLDDIEAGEMQYHSIKTVEAVVSESEEMALTARTLTDATIWGSHGVWRLRLRSSFAIHNGRWAITKTVASTW